MHANVGVSGRFGVVELRRYALRPGTRETLIDLFEREFIESQEAAGMVPFGHYRDLGNLDAFVWFRGFERMETRAAALDAFYTSDVWLRNREAANATMVDSDNVLLLRDARPHSGFDLAGLQRPAIGAASPPGSFLGVAIATFSTQPTDEFVSEFERTLLPLFDSTMRPIAYFVSEERPNDYPRLPVRADRVFVAAGVCASRREVETWNHMFAGELWERLLLDPAARSLLR